MAKCILELIVEEKVFVNKDTGESFNYYSVGTEIDGQYIKLSVPKESKALFNYLVRDVID